jgi:hypothetical protein
VEDILNLEDRLVMTPRRLRETIQQVIVMRCTVIRGGSPRTNLLYGIEAARVLA